MTDISATLTELSDAFNRFDWPKALMLANRLLPQMPRHPLLRYVAGVAELEQQNLPMALTHLHIAAELEPRRADFAVQFALALTQAKMASEARAAADQAMALAPQDPLMLDALGSIYIHANAHAEAAEAFRRAAALKPDHAPYRFNYATALVTLGEFDVAEAELETSIRLDPQFWMAHFSLAQLRKQTAEHNHITRLETLLADHGNNQEAQTYLHMALAKEYEDCSDYPAAFAHCTKGKTAAGKRSGYHIAQDEALFALITAEFSAPQPAIAGCPTREPIFVIGMPRSGTTLVERIISSHPDVHSAGELTNFGVTLKRATSSHTLLLLDKDTIDRARRLDWASIGASYLASTRPATGHTPHFIDKLPQNFLYVGWIARALPNAKIVCLRRDPLDTCLSNFRQLFAAQLGSFAYANDINDTGRYYALFDRLIAHWQRILPGRILEVQYEDLVNHQESSSRRLIDFCGLDWHDDCFLFEKNSATVNTASAVQVRQPIYRSSLQRWRKYGAQLDGLRAVLRGQGIDLPV